MSKLDLIRAGHTEVADGQCGLCDVPWPCDTGVVLAALAAAEARAEQAERAAGRLVADCARVREECDLAESTICEAADLLRADIEPDDVAIDALVIDAIKRVQGERDALRARLATVEAALTAAHGIIHEGLHGGRATDPDHQARCEKSACRRARAALAAPPAAVPDEDVAMILPPVMTFGKRQSLPDFDRREQQQHGGESGE